MADFYQDLCSKYPIISIEVGAGCREERSKTKGVKGGRSKYFDHFISVEVGAARKAGKARGGLAGAAPPPPPPPVLLPCTQDPFNEDDWESYTAFTSKGLAQIVGDDLLCTNPVRVQKAIDTKACNALLLKVRSGGGCCSGCVWGLLFWVCGGSVVLGVWVCGRAEGHRHQGLQRPAAQGEVELRKGRVVFWVCGGVGGRADGCSHQCMSQRPREWCASQPDTPACLPVRHTCPASILALDTLPCPPACLPAWSSPSLPVTARRSTRLAA